MGKFTEDSKELLAAIGGSDNIAAVSHCITRMRYVLMDPKKADIKRIERIPSVKGTFTQAGQFQVIIGNEVADFYDDFTAVSGVSGDSLFALRIKGDSMKNAGILDGDIVICEQCPVADNGDIVIVLIDDEATFKRFYKENGHFRLQPENEKYDPIIVEACAVLGKVKTLIRNY